MTSRRTTFITGGVVLLVLIAAVGGYAWYQGQDADGKQTASFDEQRQATPAESQQQAFLPPSVFTVQWSEVGDKTAASEQLLGQPDPCFPEDQDMRATSRYQAEYAYDKQPDGREAGHLTYVVTTAPTAELAQHQYSQYASAEFQSSCLSNAAQQGLARYGMPGASSTNRVDAPASTVPLVHYTATAPVSMPDGSAAQGSYDLVYLQFDTTVVRMELFSGNGSLAGPTDKDALITAAATQLAAS